MKVRLISSASVVCLIVAGLFVGAHARFLPQKPAPQSPPFDDSPIFPVGIDTLNTPATRRPLYQSMADVLSGYHRIPDRRLVYYSAVNNQNGYLIVSWGGVVRNVEANANGNLVTILVTPVLTSTKVSAIVVGGSGYLEQYQVNNDNTFTYLQSIDSYGLSGQMPSLIGL